MKLGESCLFLAALTVPNMVHAGTVGYTQLNLVSDGAVPAAHIDPDLKNPWGISFGPTSPFWISDNGSGLSTLYNGSGAKQGLVVTIPPPGGATPTGTVFNGAAGNFMGDRFLFATEDGTIAGWQGGTVATLRVPNAGGAVYKGLALDGVRIYATDFAGGKVDVFDSSYSPVALGAGAFTDPNLPAGYAPFGIQNLGGTLYVTYAFKKPGTIDDQAGPGFGFVDTYDANGNFIQRLISGDPGNPSSPLNSPWGVALAPASFGDLASLLLVGNFGDGRINAFDPATGAFVDTLRDKNGNPIVIDGLWGLDFGNGGTGFDAKKLYFTAGPNDESDGLFGSLEPVPEPGSVMMLGAGLLAVGILRRRLVSR
jgi:uncharacterized protein (TIGR03118 family)